MFHDPGKAEAIRDGIATMAPLPAAVYRQAIECLVTFDERGHLPDITQPTLCLAGEFDSTAPPKTMRQMAATLQNAKYVCLPATGHLGYIENPDAFTAAIEEFLTVD